MTPTQRVEVSKKSTHKKEQIDAEHRGIKPKRRIKHYGKSRYDI